MKLTSTSRKSSTVLGPVTGNLEFFINIQVWECNRRTVEEKGSQKVSAYGPFYIFYLRMFPVNFNLKNPK